MACIQAPSSRGGGPCHLELFPHSPAPLPLALPKPSALGAEGTWGSKSGSFSSSIPGACQSRPSREREAQRLSLRSLFFRFLRLTPLGSSWNPSSSGCPILNPASGLPFTHLPHLSQVSPACRAAPDSTPRPCTALIPTPIPAPLTQRSELVPESKSKAVISVVTAL